ncbi:MAG: hypothetical protein HZA93_06390 [Verrucomicrobia bacterium]|nr:hypothetical protein [Verrucomicrobiota bacterium]
MKPLPSARITPLALLAALSLALLPACTAPAAKPAARHAVSSVEKLGRPAITAGTSLHEVLSTLGKPHRALGDGVWLYRNFDGGFAQEPDDDCRTLKLVFLGDRVSDIELINDRAETVFAARFQNQPANLQVAAK